MEIFIAIIIAIVIALLICFGLVSQMKSVAEKQDAKDYLSGNLSLTQQSDVYTHTTTTRTKIEKDDKK